MFSRSKWFDRLGFLILETVDSTNAEAKRIIENGVDKELIIWAKEQTAGRGKYNRTWISPKENLYLSVLLKPKVELSKFPQLSFVTTVALGEVISNMLTFADIKYKWPNDILVNQKKIAGILLETCVNKPTVPDNWVIIGVGLNICSSPEKLDYPTTYINKELNKDFIEVGEILDIFMQRLLFYYDLWQEEGFETIKKKWLEKAGALGSVITVSTLKDRVSGVFQGINQDGCIEVRVSSGHVCMVSAGEIYYNLDDYENSQLR